MKKKPRFHCKSEEQKAAIRRSYAQRSNNDIPVKIKKHRDNNGGHFHIIMENIDDKHVSVGLTTHNKKGKNATNYKLKKSPLNDGKHSYMRRQGIVAPFVEYEGNYSGFMHFDDFTRATEY